LLNAKGHCSIHNVFGIFIYNKRNLGDLHVMKNVEDRAVKPRPLNCYFIQFLYGIFSRYPVTFLICITATVRRSTRYFWKGTAQVKCIRAVVFWIVFRRNASSHTSWYILLWKWRRYILQKRP
jgi:hypothetical protein